MEKLPESDNYSAWGIQIIPPADFELLPTLDQCLYLCHLAHLAPSTHNTQPWLFEVQTSPEQKITICLNRKRVLSASDASGRQAMVSIGCALENLLLAASYYGRIVATRLVPLEKKSIQPIKEDATENSVCPVVTLTLQKFPRKEELAPLVHAIPERRMTRAEYDPARPISDELTSELKKLSQDEIATLHVVTDVLRKFSIAEFQTQADSFVINWPKFSRELGDWLLPNDTDKYTGMPGAGFGLSDQEAARLHAGLSGIAPLQPEDGLRFALGGKMAIEKSPFIGFITTKDDTPPSWLRAGQIAERIFLYFTAHGVATAMHAGVTEVPLIKKIFSMTLGTLQPLTVLFRAGYVKNQTDKKRPHSPRQPLTDIIIAGKS